ncbi:MAG: deoxyguanosinetriphosphate triphosphohydrolase [Ruminococcaceae bacterium]|nr:deoxyguanosinetriphosphate triphosphohydrolase [Oscillospiraceae bacterium]
MHRERRELAEETLVGNFGVRAADSRGRLSFEEQCSIRTCFQRDIDRVTHCKSFRRLKHKTQVFLRPEGDHYRTRLTHTLEVARIARTISRALMLNEDLTEAIALAHDLGHTPFGHAGERALCEIMPGGFKHYEQSLRVVDVLEKGGRGLNLCYETRMGILNHTTGIPRDSLEAEVVRKSDLLAYINHDLDDAERAGILSLGDEPAFIREYIGTRNSERINNIVTDLIAESGEGEIRMSPKMADAVSQFREFMFSSVYHNPVAKGEESKIFGVIEGIWNYYIKKPELLPDDFLSISETWGIERAVADYISGMTDRYAMEIFGSIFIPASWAVK